MTPHGWGPCEDLVFSPHMHWPFPDTSYIFRQEACGRCGARRVMEGSYLLRDAYDRANPVFDDCDLEMVDRVMKS